jgi:hypothetical protein
MIMVFRLLHAPAKRVMSTPHKRETSAMSLISTYTTAFRLASFVTVANVLVATGFSVAGLVRPESILPIDSPPTGASSIFAMYAAARTIPLAVAILVVIYRRWTEALIALGVLAGVIQLSDSLVGLYQQDIGKTVGPLVIGGVQLWASFILLASWRKEGRE